MGLSGPLALVASHGHGCNRFDTRPPCYFRLESPNRHAKRVPDPLSQHAQKDVKESSLLQGARKAFTKSLLLHLHVGLLWTFLPWFGAKKGMEASLVGSQHRP